MNNSLTPSLVRTFVPYLVGAIVGQLAARGIDVSPEDAATLGAFLTVVFGWIYYLVVRLLERVNPKLGLLLGSAKQPTYNKEK